MSKFAHDVNQLLLKFSRKFLEFLAIVTTEYSFNLKVLLVL